MWLSCSFPKTSSHALTLSCGILKTCPVAERNDRKEFRNNKRQTKFVSTPCWCEGTISWNYSNVGLDFYFRIIPIQFSCQQMHHSYAESLLQYLQQLHISSLALEETFAKPPMRLPTGKQTTSIELIFPQLLHRANLNWVNITSGTLLWRLSKRFWMLKLLF